MQRVSYCVARFIAIYGSSGDIKNKKIKTDSMRKLFANTSTSCSQKY